MKLLRIAAAAAVFVGVLLMPVAALAAGPDDTFGQHVRACAQSVGFSGSHNPGMHHGSAGWDGMPCPT